MTDTPDKYQRAIRGFDEANRSDPNRTIYQGVDYPDELLYAQRMTEWLECLEPAASEPLRLAVRCQHLCRWMIPRSQFPMTRAGYHQWRTTLARFHADKAAGILREVGYGEEVVKRVQSLVRKEGLKSDPETQTLEDVACLVFLEYEFSDFAARHDEQKVIGIVAKTWRKMSDRGRAAALALKLAPRERELIEKALAPGAGGRAGPEAR